MKKIYFIACIAFYALCFGSCNDNEIVQTNEVGKEDTSVNYTILPTDSLEMKYSMQSNIELMVADRIIYKNSAFVLDLSVDEASELGIPDEIYKAALERVKVLNKTPENN